MLTPFRCVCVAVTALAASAPIQQNAGQQPAARNNWPCGARVDSAYFQLSEATGGHLFLLAPFEIGDAAGLLLAVDHHPQTIFRLAGTITSGVHEFRVPIDPTIESVLFSVSVQCLQNAEVLRPSGAPVDGDGVTDYSNFRAERMVVVQQPEAGTWTIRAGGSGISGVMVQARSGIGLSSIDFAAAGGEFRAIPAAGVENTVRIHVTGEVRDVQASIVDGAFKTVVPLALTTGDDEHTFLARFSPGKTGFRVAVTGRDAQGLPFQRVDARLLSAR